MTVPRSSLWIFRELGKTFKIFRISEIISKISEYIPRLGVPCGYSALPTNELFGESFVPFDDFVLIFVTFEIFRKPLA
jgi:hypothetical protein